ncbi:PREDICTED: antigen peptide transporter 1 [Nipponia nippon]|uniref:antigen peptide transporter 1 n=1 Tax=Nipponia nippon TaxID=128390 RepID=UPI000510F626|nr:PREDICTED: antigen peptide transporter 1 [Nipponia nippon]
MAKAVTEVAVPYFTGRVTDWVASEDEVAAAWPMALLGLGSAVTEFTCDVTYAGTLSRALGSLQRRVFAAVLRRDVTSLRATGSGAVTARVTGDVEATHAAVAEALSLLLWYLARGVCLLVAMVWLSPFLAFVTLLSLPVLLLLPQGVGKIQQFSALALKLGLLCYGGQLVAAGTITTGDLVTFLVYQMQFAEAVEGVSLELRPGEVLAVLAPPGAGKSTLVSLVLCLRPPEAGRVLLDGHPLPAYQHPYLRCQEPGDLGTRDMEKAEELSDSFASVFTGKCSSHTTKSQKAKAGTGRMKNRPL